MALKLSILQTFFWHSNGKNTFPYLHSREVGVESNRQSEVMDAYDDIDKRQVRAASHG